MGTMKLPLEATYRVGVGFIDMKYYEVNAEDVARILFNEFKKQQKEKGEGICNLMNSSED